MSRSHVGPVPSLSPVQSPLPSDTSLQQFIGSLLSSCHCEMKRSSSASTSNNVTIVPQNVWKWSYYTNNVLAIQLMIITMLKGNRFVLQSLEWPTPPPSQLVSHTGCRGSLSCKATRNHQLVCDFREDPVKTLSFRCHIGLAELFSFLKAQWLKKAAFSKKNMTEKTKLEVWKEEMQFSSV